MKYLYSLVFAFPLAAGLLFAGCTGSGEARSDYEYREVTQVDASADEIYDQSLSWMAQRFEGANSAIQLRDQDNKRVVANAIILVETSSISALEYELDLIVEAKDGRFRMTGRNYHTVSDGKYSIESPVMESTVEDVTARMNSLRADLASYIETSKSDDDW
jgi:hypothetical protein